MTKWLAGLMVCFSLMFLLTGCSEAPADSEPAAEVPTTGAAVTESPAPTQETAVPTQAPTEEGTAPTQAAALWEDLVLDAETVTLARKGDKAALYSGEIPLERTFWYSEDPAVALAWQGTVAAVGPGETVVHAQYGDQDVTCTVVCTADPNQTMPKIEQEFFSTPVLRPPVVDADVSAYFDDVIIMGDSTTYSLYQWELRNQQMGNALFLVRGGVSINSLITGHRKYFHEGREKLAEDAIRDSGRGKLYVMLGANDVPQFGIEKTMGLWDQFLGQILAKSPDLEIYLQSITPLRLNDQYWPGFNNEDFDAYNAALERYCQENGYHYIAVAPYFKDRDNSLAYTYSYDKMHANDMGSYVWVQILKQNIVEELGE